MARRQAPERNRSRKLMGSSEFGRPFRILFTRVSYYTWDLECGPTGHNFSWQGREGRARQAGQGRARQGGAGRGRAGQGRAGRGRAGQGSPFLGNYPHLTQQVPAVLDAKPTRSQRGNRKQPEKPMSL